MIPTLFYSNSSSNIKWAPLFFSSMIPTLFYSIYCSNMKWSPLFFSNMIPTLFYSNWCSNMKWAPLFFSMIFLLQKYSSTRSWSYVIYSQNDGGTLKIKWSVDSNIIHELVRDTKRKSEKPYLICVVSWTNPCSISESPLHFISWRALLLTFWSAW